MTHGPTIDHDRLCADYCAEVRRSVSAADLRAVNALNAVETDDSVDHIHDYVDANDCMAAALARQGLTLNDAAPFIADAWQRCRDACYQLRRVLIACEFSGRVRDAITDYGHNAVSCDVLPTESPGKHMQRDVREVLADGWSDVLSFPPCTYLCGSGAKHRKNNPERWARSMEALEFVDTLMAAPCERNALENPAGLISTLRHKPDQYVQPYQFGDDMSKRTGLWLRGFPLLVPDPADYVAPRIVDVDGKQRKRWSNQCDRSGADRTAPGPDRWRIRSRLSEGLACGMALQWFDPHKLGGITV